VKRGISQFKYFEKQSCVTSARAAGYLILYGLDFSRVSTLKDRISSLSKVHPQPATDPHWCCKQMAVIAYARNEALFVSNCFGKESHFCVTNEALCCGHFQH